MGGDYDPAKPVPNWLAVDSSIQCRHLYKKPKASVKKSDHCFLLEKFHGRHLSTRQIGLTQKTGNEYLCPTETDILSSFPVNLEEEKEPHLSFF